MLPGTVTRFPPVEENRWQPQPQRTWGVSGLSAAETISPTVSLHIPNSDDCSRDEEGTDWRPQTLTGGAGHLTGIGGRRRILAADTPLRARVDRREGPEPGLDRGGRLEARVLAVEAGDDLHALGEAARDVHR